MPIDHQGEHSLSTDRLPARPPRRTPMNDRRRLILLSFLMLFVELALIRWTGSNVLYLSYFSNFVLLGSFLGIGIGFLRGRARVDLFPWAGITLAFFVAFVLIFPVRVDRSGSELIYFGHPQRTGLPIAVTLPIVFLTVAAVMAMIGQGVARTFARFEPLEAYRLDLVGAVAGIAAFSVLSFLGAPPVVWGIIVAVLFLVLYRPRVRMIQVMAMLGLIAMLGRETLAPGDSWSAYYKVSQYPVGGGTRAVDVNGIPHQSMMTTELRRESEPVYFAPYDRVRSARLNDVLIIGAGTGSDVAIALSKGAAHVDAVEIDRRIYEIGRDLHPERPYADPRVTVHIDDGRAFLRRSSERYDLILFALPDSLTLVSGQSSLRLESYLFTIEAFRQARNHLRPTGAFTMYNYYREPWLIDRLAHTLEQAFGHQPCVERLTERLALALLTVGRAPDNVNCPQQWQPTVTASDPALDAATDNRPFVYLRSRSVPTFYLWTLGLVLLVSLVLISLVGGSPRKMTGYIDLFFMGAAFLLLETKSVVQFALLFGTTWFVNALVFLGILLSVLLAVEVARRVRIRRPMLLYGALLLSLVVAWAVPQEALLDLQTVPRFAAAVTLAFAPIFVANLVFAERFRDVGSSTVAFGANLLGAMVGGLLEYFSLVTGYRALLIAVAVLYALAFLTGRRYLTARQVEGVGAEAQPVAAVPEAR
jgi:spermidine synthase